MSLLASGIAAQSFDKYLVAVLAFNLVFYVVLNFWPKRRGK